MNIQTKAIARDLDRSAVFGALLRAENSGVLHTMTVCAVAAEAGLPTHRVTAHVEEWVGQWLSEMRSSRFGG